MNCPAGYDKRVAEPLEAIGCRGVNTLENLADAALTNKGHPELFEQTRAAYADELSSFRLHVRCGFVHLFLCPLYP